MYYLILALILLAPNVFAKEPSPTPVLGTYSAFTEADWTVAFKLKGAGKAPVTTESSYEYKADNKRLEHHKTANGTWEFNPPYLILSFGEFKDRFAQSENCHEKRPCFKYDAGLEGGSKKSPLNVKYEFINWDTSPNQDKK